MDEFSKIIGENLGIYIILAKKLIQDTASGSLTIDQSPNISPDLVQCIYAIHFADFAPYRHQNGLAGNLTVHN